MNSEEPDLDERLRRLFTDDRLTLPVPREAEQAVVAGARRRRRRRLVLASSSGVLAVAAVVFVVAALTTLGRGHGPVEAASPRLSQTPGPAITTESPTPAVTWPPGMLNEAGIDGLRLGMSQTQVNDVLRGGPVDRQIGMAGKCVDYELMFPATPSPGAVATTATPPDSIALKEGFAGSHLVMLLVSPRYGVVQIGGTSGVHTPEGIYPGMPRSVIENTYPSATTLSGGKTSPSATLAAPVPGRQGDYYVFAIGPANTVTAVWLRGGATLPC